jgi:predicted acetyltransferase
VSAPTAEQAAKPTRCTDARRTFGVYHRFTMRIVPLSIEHEEALAAFRREFERAGEGSIPGFLPRPEWSFSDMVSGFDAWSRGEDLPEGWVAGTTWFLVEGDRIFGVVNLRHRLSRTLREYGGHVGYSVRPSERGKGHATRLLEHAKTHAREFGIERLLITCDRENTASARVIEKSGGVLEDEIFYEPIGRHMRRFWIDLA